MPFGLDTVTSALDTASQALAGGTNNPDAPADASKPVYVRGIHIDAEDAETGGSTAGNLVNERDHGHLLEFIHFGNVHTSYSTVFPHPSYQDSKKEDAIKEKMRPRAIQFRAALQREAILLSVFMQCTQTVLQERDNSKGNLADPASLAGGSPMGALGSAMDTMGSLTGSGGGGSGQTTASSMNAPVQKVADAIKPLLAESIKYIDTHKAGRDLHQARADYRTLLRKVSTEKPAAAPGGGLLGKLPGLGSVAGPIGGIISFAQGIAFKPQDVRVKFFAKVAVQQERQIESACHAMTLKAIADLINPVLPVWFGDPNAQATQGKWDSAPDSPVKEVTDDSNQLKDVVNKVATPVTKARNDAVGAANDLKGFFEVPTPPTPPPGSEFVGQAFDVPKPAKGKIDPMPMAMGSLAVQAFIEALGLTPPLNSFCEGVISTVFAVTLDFIRGTYEALLLRSGDEPITDAALHEAAITRLKIVERLLALASEKVSFIQKARDFGVNAPMGYNVGVGQLIDKEGAKIEDLIEEKIRPIMDEALKRAMANLAKQLDLGRFDGKDNNCQTMEWYLGRLPWVQATLFCDLFFPFWNALLQCVMGVVDPAAASVIKSIVGVADKMKGVVDAARDKIAQAQALKNAASNTMDRVFSGDNLLTRDTVEHLDDGFGDAMDAKAAKTTGPSAAERGAFVVAVKGRNLKGKGENVLKTPDLDTVVPEHKWDEAQSADEEPAKDDAAPAGTAKT